MLVNGPITKEFVASQSHYMQKEFSIGSQLQFMGQVRADSFNETVVEGITYSAYEHMAEQEITNIVNDLINKYELDCCKIFHSLGFVPVGEWSLFIIMATKHRKHLFAAMDESVTLIKKLVPIWKKEIYSNKEEKWK